MTGPEPGETGEFGLIDWFRRQTPASGRISVGIGDDCAAIPWTSDGEILVTTDMLMDGRHFRLGEASPRQIGNKAMGVNLSDIAAMAGIPIAAVVSVALPRASARSIAPDLHRGLLERAAEFEVDLVGGDTNAWDGPLVISLTVLGRCGERGPVLRRGASPGDEIYVTGPLGGSILGRHLNPRPRIREALALHREGPISAMLDISDGLASDLGHLLEESGGLGAILDAEAIPIHADALALERIDGRPALEHALTDGEDFELCLTLNPERVARRLSDRPDRIPLHRVGRVTVTPGLFLVDSNGRLEPWTRRGFDHLDA